MGRLDAPSVCVGSLTPGRADGDPHDSQDPSRARSKDERRALRIALVIRRWSRRGGNERIATDLAEYLSARGHEVRAIVQKSDGTAREPAKLHHVWGRGVGFDPALGALSFAWGARRAVAALRAARAVDVVLGFNHSIDQDVYRLGGGTHAEYLVRTRRRGWLLDKAALHLEQARLTPPRRQALIAPSRRVADELYAHYGIHRHDVDVIPNGIEQWRFAEARDRFRAEARAEFGVGKEPVAAFVGHELERKGFGVAVDAAGRAGTRLLVASRARPPRRLPPYVIWAGSRGDIERIYAASDVLLLPTLYEPFGLVVLEALAAGLPVVVSKHAGASEVIEERSLAALLVGDPTDTDAFAAGLVRAVGKSADFWSGRARATAAPWTLRRFADRVEGVLLRNA